MRRLREGVLLSKDAQLGAACKNAQLVTRLQSPAEPPGRSCRAPAATTKLLPVLVVVWSNPHGLVQMGPIYGEYQIQTLPF